MIKILHFSFILLFPLLICNSGYANSKQANMIKFKTAGNLNFTSEEKIYLFENSIGYDYKINHVELNTVANWVYSTNNNTLVNNDFTANIYGNYFFETNNRWNAWILGGFKSQYSLNIVQERQLGLGIAYKILDIEKNRRIHLRVSNGIISENSHYYNKAEDQFLYQLLRNSLRVQCKLNLLNQVNDQNHTIPKLTFSSSTMWQPALNKSKDYNLIADAELQFKLSSSLALSANYAYNFVSRTMKESTVLSFGLSMGVDFLKKK